VPDVRGDEAQRLGALHFGDHPLAVVEDLETGHAALAAPGDADVRGAGVEAVLHQLG